MRILLSVNLATLSYWDPSGRPSLRQGSLVCERTNSCALLPKQTYSRLHQQGSRAPVNILLLSEESTSRVEQPLSSLAHISLHREPCSGGEAYDCVILEGYEDGRPIPLAWQEQLGETQAVLLIRDSHPDTPYLAKDAISTSTLPVAISWARQHLLLRRQRQEALTRSHQIIAHVTHELRSPLTVISLATQLAMKSGLPEEKLHQHLGMVRESSQALQSLVNDILDYSRMTSGKLELTSAEFDFVDFLNNVCDCYRLLAEEKGVQLVLDFDSKIPNRVIGDPGRLRQILANLLANAVKFTQNGLISVFVRLTKLQTAGVDIEFTVRDTGVGIPAEAMSRIFVAYEQAEDSTYHQFGGTGLGLSIARQLVAQMGGSIRVMSQVAKGSTFTFDVSLGRVRSMPANLRRQGSLLDLPTLVIQKNDRSRRKLCKQLKSWGCRVWSSGDRLHGLRLALTASEGLVIVDLDDLGFEFVEELRNQPGLATTDFVVLTSVGQRGDAVQCQKLKVRAYLSGILEPEIIQKALELTLTRRYSLVTQHTVRECGQREQARQVVTLRS